MNDKTMISKKSESKQSEYRIKMQLQQIRETQFPFPIRISQKKNRTVIFALIFPIKGKTRESFKKEKPAKVYFNRQEKWEENYGKIEYSLQSKEHFQFSCQRNENEQIQDEEIIHENQQARYQKQICFGIFIQHNIYPYQSPYITICNQCIFPGACEFKDYFYDIMEISTWWPTFNLKDILFRLPDFAYRLEKSYSENRMLKSVGTYQYNYPLYISDIQENAKYFISTNCQMKFKGQFKKNVFIAMTSQYLLILKQSKDKETYLIDKKIKTEEIIEINCTKNKKKELFQLRMSNESTIIFSIKKQTNKIFLQSIFLLKFYIKYYQLTKLIVQMHIQDKIKIVETINQFIGLADIANHKEAIQWGKTQSKLILQSFYNI